MRQSPCGPGRCAGLAAVVEELLELTAADVLIMACEHQSGLDLIGRARPGAQPDLRQSCRNLAAAAGEPRRPCRKTTARPWAAPLSVLVWRWNRLGQITAEPTAAAIMTSSVVTLKDDATIADARRIERAPLKAAAVVGIKAD